MSNFKNAHHEWITGTVQKVFPDKGFGFVRGVDGGEYFFHRHSTDDFDTLTVGTAVRFIPTAGSKGPRADRVEIL